MPDSQRRPVQFTLPTLLTAVLLAALLASYIGTYCWLSRRGMAEAEAYGMDGFLYTPFDEAFETHDLRQHYRRMRFFAPANWIDRHCFGGPYAIRGITFELSDMNQVDTHAAKA